MRIWFREIMEAGQWWLQLPDPRSVSSNLFSWLIVQLYLFSLCVPLCLPGLSPSVPFILLQNLLHPHYCCLQRFICHLLWNVLWFSSVWPDPSGTGNKDEYSVISSQRCSGSLKKKDVCVKVLSSHNLVKLLGGHSPSSCSFSSCSLDVIPTYKISTSC